MSAADRANLGRVGIVAEDSVAPIAGSVRLRSSERLQGQPSSPESAEQLAAIATRFLQEDERRLVLAISYSGHTLSIAINKLKHGAAGSVTSEADIRDVVETAGVSIRTIEIPARLGAEKIAALAECFRRLRSGLDA